LSEEETALQSQVMAAMGDADTLTSGGNVLATWKSAKAPERIDTKRLRADHPEIAAHYTNIGEPSRRFIIK
jgi:predicted phage-related endonuclease